jgi:hypothetical protein
MMSAPSAPTLTVRNSVDLMNIPPCYRVTPASAGASLHGLIRKLIQSTYNVK